MAPAAVKPRLQSVDLLRGFAMVFMVLDHVRDYLALRSLGDARQLAVATPQFFITRWITHLCAPIFVFLAGAGAALQLAGGRSRQTVARYLLLRGLLLMVLEPTLISFEWSFNFAPMLQVIWALGISMCILGLLVRIFPERTSALLIPGIGAVIVALHNTLDGIHPQGIVAADLWRLVHQAGPLETTSHQQFALLLYPFLPWSGLMMLGFGFGTLLHRTAPPRRWAAITGAALLVFFAALRFTNLYGDPEPWSRQAGALHTLQSFLNVSKYPPSLLYLCVTIGVALLLFSAFERWHADGLLRRALLTFGRVPMFFYVLHIATVHLLALALTAITHHGWRWWISRPPNGGMLMGRPPGFGFPLWGVYLFWLGILVLLYPACRWYARIRPHHRLLSYF